MASVFALLEAFNRKEAAALGFFPCATASWLAFGSVFLRGRRGSGFVDFAVFFVGVIELLRRNTGIQTPLQNNRIVAAADREQLVAVRRVHRVNHDFMRRAVCIRDRYGSRMSSTQRVMPSSKLWAVSAAGMALSMRMRSTVQPPRSMRSIDGSSCNSPVSVIRAA